MKVLLTGASGFIGRYVLGELQRRNIDTVVVGRKPPLSGGKTQFIETDLLATTDFSALMNEAKATHLLHIAWYAEHGKFWNSPLNLRWVDATTRLVEAFCAAGGQRVVAAGSCTEYDWSHVVLKEDSTPLNPATLYGTAKDATRRLLTALCAQLNVPLAWGRIFFLYGSGENRARLIPALIDCYRGQRAPISVNADAGRDYLHVSDVASAFITLLQSGARGEFNICSGQAVKLSDIAREIARQLGVDPQSVLALAADRPGEPKTLYGDAAKLRALGWQPALTLSQGLAATLRETTR